MTELPWWHHTSIYQVYPRSFADSNGDGIGDLPGIIDHLDHIADLGVETLWVSPFFASPQGDFGYDVSDYCDVAPEYGTLADAERLIEEAHGRGLKVMFDLVLNHTSDQHRWFLESRSSRTNPKADWYIWRDGRGPKGGRHPNNWHSALEVKSAWQWCPERGQWFLASFLPFQPDLNWRNAEVKAAMFDVVRFWLDRGVDGFRLDIFGSIMKDPGFRNNPVRPAMVDGTPRVWARKYTENTEDNARLACELRAVCDEYAEPDRVLIGEVFGAPEVLRRYTADGTGLQLVFLFEFLTYRYSARWFRKTIAEFEAQFPRPLEPTYVLENHDRSRTIDRVGGDLAKAGVLATILVTARGVPTIYMGQEVGMANTYLPLKTAQDPIARQFFWWLPEFVSKRLPERVNRDEVRTPMQWDATANAGFSPAGSAPWLPVNANYRTRNVAAQQGDPNSLLELYRVLLHARRTLEPLRSGRLHLRHDTPEHVLAYERRCPGGDGTAGSSALVVANLGHDAVDMPVGADAALVVATGSDVVLADGRVHLPADRAAVLTW